MCLSVMNLREVNVMLNGATEESLKDYLQKLRGTQQGTVHHWRISRRSEMAPSLDLKIQREGEVTRMERGSRDCPTRTGSRWKAGRIKTLTYSPPQLLISYLCLP